MDSNTAQVLIVAIIAAAITITAVYGHWAHRDDEEDEL